MESMLKAFRDGESVLDLSPRSTVSGGVVDIYDEDRAIEDQIVTPWTFSVASGYSLLRDPQYNEGLAFTEKERDAHYLYGLLTPTVCSQQLEEKKLMHNIRQYEVPLQKYVAMMDLQTPKRATIDGYYQVTASENGLLSASAQQPISVYIYVNDDFYLYQGGIYYGQNCPDDGKTNHAVLIVGYGTEDDQDYWIVKNSWGTRWGINGYVKVQRNSGKPYGVCGINHWAYYPVKNSRASI